jgi:hypothetical protein
VLAGLCEFVPALIVALCVRVRSSIGNALHELSAMKVSV